jgi:hypothetical protein
MNDCAVCGNTYDKSFSVTQGSETFSFDCFECAIHKLAPSCDHCGCRIVGHGVEAANKYFCCAHCARESGEQGLVDHV